MRTTLTLDPDVAERLRTLGATGKYSQKTIINEALRRGLAIAATPKKKRFCVNPINSPFCAGVDRMKLNHLVDDLATESFTAKRRRPRP